MVIKTMGQHTLYASPWGLCYVITNLWQSNYKDSKFPGREQWTGPIIENMAHNKTNLALRPWAEYIEAHTFYPVVYQLSKHLPLDLHCGVCLT